ncbi:MAG: GHMP kinase [Chloroflexi bacterium]|nr:GHMP kinase [Chloroflexota bacterium]
MIVSCAPFRVSFVGGGSDLPSFYQRHGGAVLSCTVAKYSFAIIHPFFDSANFNLKYARNEVVSDVDHIENPILREVLRFLNITGGLEIASIADIPSGTGLGSSSSFCVALLNGLYAHAGKFVPKERLAQEACLIEIERLGEPIGKQDQYAAAFGGINFIEFHRNGSVTVEPLPLDREIVTRLEQSLMLFYTGTQRAAGGILAEQRARVEHDEAAVTTLRRMVDLSYGLRDRLVAGDLDAFGHALHENWLLKRSLTSQISTTTIDRAYAAALAAGALGGKLAGAGGGGFLVIYCPPAAQPPVRAALAEYREVDFRFDLEGARIVFAR